MSTFEAAVVVLLFVIAGSLVAVVVILQRTMTPSIRQRLRMLEDRTAFNLELARKHHEMLARFALSEANIGVKFEYAAEREEMDEDAREIAAGNVSWWQRMKSWIGRNVDTLVGKVNDIAKSALGLGGGK
jgi:hypothetical protein